MKTSKLNLSLIVTALIFQLGCQKSGNSTSGDVAAAPGFIVSGTCVNCADMNRTVILQSNSQAQNGVSATTTLEADTFALQQNTLFGNSPTLYQGRAVLSGTLRVSSTVQSGICTFPAGTYVIQALNPTFMTYGILRDEQVQLIPQFAVPGVTGPIPAVISQAVIYGGTRLLLNLRLLQGPAIAYTGYGQPVFNSMVNCQDAFGITLN